jgi:hypothetical protein
LTCDRALRALNLEFTDKMPLLGTIGDAEFAERITGISRHNYEEHIQALYRTLDVDIVYRMGIRNEQSMRAWEEQKVEQTVYGSFEDFREDFPFTDAWHTAYKGCRVARTPTATYLWVAERPFKTYDQLKRYLKRYDPREDEERSVKEIAENYKESWGCLQDTLGNLTLVAGEFYLTLLTFFIAHIGWNFMARLIYQDQNLFDEVLAKYAEVSKKHVEAWSRTGIKAFVSHDDIATELGPMVSPAWYWKHLFPLYRKIWQPTRDKGIKLIFVSDGDYTPLIDGLVWAGVDGLKINPDARLSHTDLTKILAEYGGRKVLSISVRREKMIHGSRKEIISELGFLMSLAKKYNGVFIHQEDRPTYLDAYYETWVKNRIRK